RPRLPLSEYWSKKGVAVAIVRAADRKSLVLLGLVLLVCVMFLANAVAAAVRDRRRELGILACLGWAAPPPGPARPLLATPIGVGLALLPAAAPAVSASRSTPAESLAPAVRPPRRARRQ